LLLLVGGIYVNTSVLVPLSALSRGSAASASATAAAAAAVAAAAAAPEPSAAAAAATNDATTTYATAAAAAAAVSPAPTWSSSVDAAPFPFVVYNVALALAFVSHVRVAFTDPGSVPPAAQPTPAALAAKSTLFRCRRCSQFKPPRAHHCRICNRCITKMDHHCPWVNNCVGVRNQKFFLLFLGYALVVCAYGGWQVSRVSD
jgi:palmitoyltransferase